MSKDDDLKEAQGRFERAAGWESAARTKFRSDYRFAHGDSYNGWQWPSDLRQDRELRQKPCLTVNKTRQHNLQIKNDMRQNRPGVKIRAVGGKATYEAAQVLMGLVRHIEYESNAQDAYDTAASFMVDAGFGYWRVETDYVSADSFDQKILISRVVDPLSVYLDPDAKEADKSDARYGFVVDFVPDDLFALRYPKYKHLEGTSSTWDGTTVSIPQMKVTAVVEYFRVHEKEDVLYAVPGEDGTYMLHRESLLKADPNRVLLNEFRNMPGVRRRKVLDRQVERIVYVGNTEVERQDWPGQYIPLVLCCAEETVVDGVMDRKGHTRALLDIQRMYNYWSSTATEYGALQTQTPWMVPVETIEEFQQDWNEANIVTKAFLPIKAYNDEGQQLPVPQRIQPPMSSPVALSGLQIASSEFGMASGQFEANFGQVTNERTGKAINARQEQGERATYHYVNARAIAIRYTGKILLDLIPRIYDTKRTVQILAEDGTDYEVTIDPQQREALRVQQFAETQVVQRTLNPGVGLYEVQADVGPAYATRREEAFNALTLILTQAPQLVSLIGDLLLKAGDFPMAEEAAERLRRMVPPQALGTGPTPTEQGLQLQVQNLQSMLGEAMEELAKKELELKSRASLRDVNAYRAITDRLKVLFDTKLRSVEDSKGNLQTPPADVKWLMDLLDQAGREAAEDDLRPVTNASEQELTGFESGEVNRLGRSATEVPRVDGATRGHDGQLYARNLSNSRVYTRV